MGFQPDGSLRIQVDRRNGVARLALRGELDMGTAPELEANLMLLEGDGVRAVLLDVRDLAFIDSTGLHTFLRARSRAADNGHRMALVGANEQLRRLLHLTGTEHAFDEHEGLRLLERFTQHASPQNGRGTSGDTNRGSDD